MEIGAWWAFVVVLWAALVVPGPDFVVVVQAATVDARRGGRVAAGVVASLCVHAAAAALGLGLVLSSLPGAAVWLQVVGAGVLVWLGRGMLRARTAPGGGRRPGSAGGAVPEGRWFLRGFAVNVSNPKALLFFAAIVPQFVVPDRPVPAQLWLLGSTVVVCAALWWTAVVAAVRLSGLGRNERARRAAAKGGGTVLVVTGAALGLQAVLG